MKKYFESNCGYCVCSSYRAFVYSTQKSDILSDLALANVETLASGEWGVGVQGLSAVGIPINIQNAISVDAIQVVLVEIIIGNKN